MTTAKFEIIGVPALAADFVRVSEGSTKQVELAVRQGAELLKTTIQRHASGRPGPNAPTGDYRRSWSVQPINPTTVSVGTNKPQGRRLEFGFYGVDALGRHYQQPPFPHVAVSVDEAEPAILTMVRAAVERSIL